MRFKYLIVDDEPLARKLILAHTSKIDSLDLVKECATAFDAMNVLRSTKVDLIFLDIQMPELTGLDFIRALKQPPAIILTTAHRDFAIDAFELDALDYILKPVSFERLMKAVNKFFLLKQGTAGAHEEETFHPIIHIKADRKIYPVDAQEILYFESMDDYVKVHLKDKVLITRENISTLEQRLPASQFVRIHRSFIVSKPKIDSISAEAIQIGGKVLPFGRAFKQSALAFLKIKM